MSEENTMDDNGSTRIFRIPSNDATVPDLMSREKLANPTLSIIKGPQTGVSFVLDQPEISIGRDPKNAIFLNDMTVSRHHAHISLNAGKAVVEDLGSLNGTWVDGAIVSKAFLEDGSTIQIGTFRMVFHTTQGTERIATGE